MCIRKEETEFYQPIAELDLEFAHHAANVEGASNPLPELAWAGTRAFYGLLENA